MLTLIVPLDWDPAPLKDFLRRSGLSLTLRRKVKYRGSVRRNGERLEPHMIVKPGEVIELDWAADCHLEPIQLDLKIVYEDDYVLIIDKPAGLLVHPTSQSTDPTLANGVVDYYRRCNCAYGFHPIHRLDKNTSGLIAIAKYPHIQHGLLSSSGKLLRRTYLAIVTGCPEPPQGRIHAPIARKPGSIIERIVSPDGQEALTNYQVIIPGQEASLVEAELDTGRTHQIRVHFSYKGHPLLGDDLYGGATNLINRQALHAAALSFPHPINGHIVNLTSPLPPDMACALRLVNLLAK